MAATHQQGSASASGERHWQHLIDMRELETLLLETGRRQLLEMDQS